MTTEGDNARTLVSLRDYIERRLEDHCQLNEARFNSLENATHKSSEIMDLRLAGMNEFRDALRDQTSRYVTFDRMERLEERLKSLEILMVSAAATTATMKIMVGALVAVLIAVAIGLITGQLHIGPVQ
jgi:hypothetical protein